MKELVGGLPERFPATIILALHLNPSAPSAMPQILTKAGPLPASFPADFEPLKSGHIYVAPPDHHLLLEQGHVRLTRGPKENRFRPSVDTLFRSAAYAYGPRVVGVVLTGMLDDGVAGLWAVKDRGGAAIVQDPKEAPAPSMPQSAMRYVEVGYRLPLNGIAPLLKELAHTPAAEEGAYPVSERMKIEVQIAKEHTAIDKGIQDLFEA
jgi:two-component system chemotaxis response regulator CheB